MKHIFKIAENSVAISVSEGVSAWEEIERRYRPFATAPDSEKTLEIDIRSGALPENSGERIYKPEYGGIGFITACASRLDDGAIVMEFSHVKQEQPSLWMRMTPRLDRAEIVIVPDCSDSAHFLTHALMIAFMLGTCRTGTLLIHASSVLYDGKAYLFQGKSGTGKSTHSALWTRHIPGAELLNDDNPVIRFSPDGMAMAYGSPWSGKTHCYRNVSAPIGALVRIVRAKNNELRRLEPLRAYASLTTSVFFMPFLSEELLAARHRVIERLATEVPCCEMYCRPDCDAAFTCRDSLCNS